jgi:HD superfamily phosphodiesterase
VSSNLWARISLEARARARSNEPAHDFFHVERVVANALAIARGEGLGGCRKKVG